LIDALVAVLALGLAFSITVSELTLLALAVAIIAGGRAAALRDASLAGPLLAFAGWSLVTAAVSAQPAESLRATKSLLVLATFWIVLAALPTAAAARRFATALFVTVSAAALLSIVQVMGCPADGGYGAGPKLPVIGGFFRKCVRAHGFFSIYMTLAGVLTVVLALTLPRLRGFSRPALASFGWLAGAVALGLTLVRGAWVGFAVGIVVVLVLLRRRSAALMAIAALAVVALSIPSVHRRLGTIADVTDPTARERLAMLSTGLRLIAAHPVTGIGPGHVKMVYPTAAPPEAMRRHTSHLHDTPLQIAVERGIVGLALWLWIFVAFFVRAGRVLRRLPAAAATDRALVVGALAAVAAFLVSGLFEYNFGDTEVLLVTLAVMSLPFVIERDRAGTAA
jgi:putative inorganic carbon (HCO3(-)) transporter